MLPPWMIEELERTPRERRREREERPCLEVELPLPSGRAPRTGETAGPIVIRF
jgi:hypothetical protein